MFVNLILQCYSHSTKWAIHIIINRNNNNNLSRIQNKTDHKIIMIFSLNLLSKNSSDALCHLINVKDVYVLGSM